LFLKKGLICVIYVDDTLFTGPDESETAEENAGLGVSKYKTQHKFQLRDEGKVGDILGIWIANEGEGTFLLTQNGLIEKGSENCWTGRPQQLLYSSSQDSLWGRCRRRRFCQDLGVCLCNRHDHLSGREHATRYCICCTPGSMAHSCPRGSHAVAVKRIIRYLKGTKDKGLYFNPDSTDQADFYVNADFAGTFSGEDGKAPVSVKLITGFVIMYYGVPVLWVSKMQTHIALSTMEDEYTALSQLMRDLIPIQEMLKDFKRFMLLDEGYILKCNIHSKAFKEVGIGEDIIPPSLVYEDNEACLKFAQMPKLQPRTKHIGVPFHWFTSKIIYLEISVKPILSVDHLADQFTKGLAQEPFEKVCMALVGW
jgi:hypothetical protein